MVGEFSPQTGLPAEEYVEYTIKNFGTAPEVIGLIINKKYPKGIESSVALQTLWRSSAETPIKAPFPKFQSDNHPVLTEAVTPPASRSQNGPGYWAPEQAEFSIRNYGTNQAVFNHSYWWVGGESPANIPRNSATGWGAEFEVNLFNDQGTDTRPFCLDPNYKDLFWAKNYGWSWSVLKPNYTSANLSALGAYADYNDQTDDCDRNSIAIGLRYPQNIQYSNGTYGILINVIAPRGTKTASMLSSEVALVWDGFCTSALGSLMAFTDCMGGYPGTWTGPGLSYAMTLNISNEWIVPAKCWLTYDYGASKIQFTPCL